MSRLVTLHMCFSCKSFATSRTHKRFFTSVCPFVGSKSGFTRKNFGTYVALVLIGFIMFSFVMIRKTTFAWKLDVTLLAQKYLIYNWKNRYLNQLKIDTCMKFTKYETTLVRVKLENNFIFIIKMVQHQY